MSNRIFKRILSAVLSAVMVLAMLPAMAFAEATTFTQITSAEELVTGQYVMVAGGYAPGVYDAG